MALRSPVSLVVFPFQFFIECDLIFENMCAVNCSVLLQATFLFPSADGADMQENVLRV